MTIRYIPCIHWQILAHYDTSAYQSSFFTCEVLTIASQRFFRFFVWTMDTPVNSSSLTDDIEQKDDVVVGDAGGLVQHVVPPGAVVNAAGDGLGVVGMQQSDEESAYDDERSSTASSSGSIVLVVGVKKGQVGR